MWPFNKLWFWILIILDILLTKYYSKLIGLAGELWVKLELKKLPKDYLILNDVMIETKDESTHQVDHIVVSKYGIFVIETKQYNGYIKGNDYDKKWEINLGKQKYYVTNPVHQNYGHIKSLQEVLSLNENNFISIVCISSRARLKIKSNIVTPIASLLDKILSYKEEVLPNYEEIYNKLLDINIIDKSKRKKHVKQAKNIKKEKEQQSVNKCPKCGGNLIIRNGKYGSFIGCSNYPRCKYTKKR